MSARRFAFAVVVAAFPAVLARAVSLPPAEAGSAACSCIAWWTTKELRIGHPNDLNRRDRTTLRFDLSPWLARGRVAKAELRLPLWYFGFTNANGFVVHRLTRDRETLRAADTLSQDAEEVARFVIRKGEPNPTVRRLDVTEAANGILASGHVQLVLRIRDATVEKRGNPDHRAEGAMLLEDGLKLEIEE